MKILMTLLMLSSTALALEGTPRNEWWGKAFPGPGSGKPSVYVFALPNCAPCALQLARVTALKRRYFQLEVVVVAQDKKTMREFLSSYAMKARLEADPEGKLVRSLALKEIPALVLVDAQNTVRGFYEGQLSLSEMLDLGGTLALGKTPAALHPPAARGEQAPALRGVSFKGAASSLIIFHSSTCPYCKRQLPDLLEYARDNPKVPIWIVVKSDLEAVRRQFAAAPGNLRLTSDPDAYTRFVVRGTPVQLRVDSSGRVTWRLDGFEPGTFKTALNPNF